MSKSQWFGAVLCGAGIFVAGVYAQEQSEKASGKKSAPAEEAAPADMKDIKDKVSYGFGFNQGKRLAQSGIEFNPQMVAKGFADAFAKKDAQYTEAELEAAFAAFEKEMSAQQEARAAKLAVENQKQGDEFLAENKEKEGVKSTDSGLQYKVLKSGEKGAASPKKTDMVTTHYEGRLIDGTVFDSSLKRGEPATFPLNRVIKGWTEALQLMKIGDKWRIFVPSELAYGENPPMQGGPIGPNAVLVFDIELLEVEAGAAEEEEAAPRSGLKLNTAPKLKTKRDE
jgi:FKBP-type peptidyl-prolyl cis-trans isomerase FklB